MQQIRPVSDLRNRFTEIEEAVLGQDDTVVITKNGRPTFTIVAYDSWVQWQSGLDEQKIVEAIDEIEASLATGKREYMDRATFDKRNAQLMDEIASMTDALPV